MGHLCKSLRDPSAFPIFTKDGVEDEESQEEQESKRSSDSLIFLDGLRMMYGGGVHDPSAGG